MRVPHSCLVVTDSLFYNRFPIISYWELTFSVNIRKCCSKLYLIKMSCRSIRNPEKGLSSLFMKSYSLDKKLSESRLHSFPKKNYFILSISEMMGWMPSTLSHMSDLVEILSHWMSKRWNLLKTWRSACFKLFRSSHPYNNVGITIFRYRLTRVSGFVLLDRSFLIAK